MSAPGPLRLLAPALSLLLCLGPAACRPGTKGGAGAARPAPALADVAGELDDGSVMTFLFGNWDREKERSVLAAAAGSTGGTPPRVVTVEGFYEIPGSEPQRVLLMTATSPEGWDSHGQAALLGGAVFEKVPGGWKAVVRTAEIAEMGSYGSPPDGTLVEVGPGRWGVAYSPGFSNTGETAEGFALVAETDGALREVLALSGTAGENGGACDEDAGTCWAYESVIRYEPRPGSGWFDVVVATSGTRAGRDGRAEEFRETRRFAFDGTKYAEAPPAPQKPE